ncbi:carbon-nitrogen hydrolase [Rhizophagus diaphanus]|nr:carbon-nitrogen hydrolase [Rhizophagus diaphanus] [Rhizophagus sp. MUCL 43196]
MMNSIGFLLAYLESFNLGAKMAKVYAGVIYGMGLVIGFALLIPYIFDRIAQHRLSSDGWARVMVFPCIWTGMSTILLFASPLGDIVDYAFTFLNYDEIMQFTSFAGLGGINFMLAWWGTVGCDLISHRNSKPSTIDNRSSTEDNNSDIILKMPPTHPTRKLSTLPTFINSFSIYLFVLFLVLSYGSVRLSTNYVPFYQQKIESTFPEELINVGCVLRQENILEVNYYVELTRELAASGNKIILWSEGLSDINSAENLTLLYNSIQNISTSYGAIIGFTYIDYTTQNSYNKQVVFDNKGAMVVNYNKTHLVPVLENDFVKGDDKLQTFQSEVFGNVGAAICYDFNFPILIGQASSKNVNLMLDSGNTWGIVAVPKARINIIRSIENGFATFRCYSYGISGVWNQFGQPLHYAPTVNTPKTSFQVPISMLKNRVKTVYSVFGETLGWICVGSIGIITILLVIMEIGGQKLRDKINNWT